ncbi:MAG TPA: hypothetical protein VGI19_15885 [Candidatus Cybelea sp.]
MTIWALRRSAAIVGAAGFAALAGLIGCSFQSSPGNGALPLHGASLPATSSGGPHLYVADGTTIYRFALVNGLPNTTPEKVFATGPTVGFLGVDGSGAIYAAGTSGTGAGFIEKYDGNGTLEGTAKLEEKVGAFAVDSQGYMYVGIGGGADFAFTYAPNIFKEASAQPIATLMAKGGYQFVKLAVGDRGRLYTAAFQNVNVFYHPHQSASGPSATFKTPPISWSPVFPAALAFDENNRFYGSLSYLDYCNRRCSRTKYKFLYTDFDNVLHPLAANRSDHIVYGRGCRIRTSAPYGWTPGYVTGMAVYGGYIDAACSGDTVGVWVFRANRFGHQYPLERLSGLVNPTDAKVGP